MKKLLAMSLTLSMLAGLLAMPVAAKDYTDSTDVQYSEAVDVISAINIIDGYEDGSFNPQGTLTRGAAAKIICNMLLGPTTASALGADTAPFPDVTADHTFAGYIAYCASEGIIDGYEDGTFRPAGEVTGYQFMKMLLGALGYSSSVESFTGSNWSINVAKLALAAGLDTGNEDFAGSAAMTREEAALYAFNTLSATMVEYESLGSDIVVGDLNITVGASKASQMANNGNSDGNIESDSLMQFAEKTFTDLKKTSTSADVFGRPAREWTVKNTAVGTYVDVDTLQASYQGDVTRGTLYTLLGKTLVNKLEADTNSLSVFVDGYETQVDAADVSDYIRSNSSLKVAQTGSETQVFVSDDDDVTIVTIQNYVVQATGDYNVNNEEVRFSAAGDTAISFDASTLSSDDFDVEDVMEDDYLIVQVSRPSGAGSYTVETVTPATVITGEVTTYTKGSSVTIDGTKYSYNITAQTAVHNTAYSVGEDTTVVLDGQGNIIAVDQVVTSSEKYVFIRDTASEGSFNTTIMAAAFLADGTYSEITLKKVADSTASADLLAASGWYTYAVDSNDKYTLTALDTDETADDATYTSAGTALSVTTSGKVSFLTGETVKANGATVFVTVDSDDEVLRYDGILNLPTINTSAVSGNVISVNWIEDTNGFATFVFIDMSADSKASVDNAEASASDYVYILDLDSTGVDANGDDVYTYNAIVDGEQTTIQAEDNATFEAGKLYNNIKTNSTGYVSSAKEVTDGGEYALGDIDDTLTYNSGTLEIGSELFIVGDDTQIIVISKASDLNKDEGADYEISTGLSGKALANMVSDYTTITGSYYAVLEDDDSVSVDAIYVTIDAVAE